MKIISEASLSGKRVLIRVDFNVPLDNGTITDDKRMVEALPTIQHVLENGGSVVLMSHLGRPKGEAKPEFSTSQLDKHLEKLLGGKDVIFGGECVGEKAIQLTAELKPGQVVLLENTRYHAEEKKGDLEFAKKLALHGDVYVNDAFGTAHRAHASTTTVAQFFEEKYAGFLLAKELKIAGKVMENADKPFTAIMGGSKVSDKIGMIQRLLDKVDNILIGGAMAYTFLKAKGMPIGASRCEMDKIALAASLMKLARKKEVTILTPVDHVVADAFDENAKTQVVRTADFPKEWMGLDIGPETFRQYYQILLKSKTILWNGPMGVFEMKPFASGTTAIAQAVAEATEKGAFSLIGGGDSAAAVAKNKLEDKVSYVSTGGGALLELLEGKTLPGVAALD